MTQTAAPATVPTFCAGTGKRRVRHAAHRTVEGITYARCGATAAVTVPAPATAVTCRRCAR